MRPIFMIRHRKREGNCHRVERQAFYERKLRQRLGLMPATCRKSSFPEFRKDVLQEHG